MSHEYSNTAHQVKLEEESAKRKQEEEVRRILSDKNVVGCYKNIINGCFRAASQGSNSFEVRPHGRMYSKEEVECLLDKETRNRIIKKLQNAGFKVTYHWFTSCFCVDYVLITVRW